MRAVALFFSPIVAAVTFNLQKMLTRKITNIPMLGGGIDISTSSFLLVLGIYVITITILLVSYSVEIEWGEDQVIKRASLAQALPVSVSVFMIGIFISKHVLPF